MKTFEVEIKRTQLMTTTVEAESLRDAIDKAEDNKENNWLPWDQLEDATYEVTHINQIPNKE